MSLTKAKGSVLTYETQHPTNAQCGGTVVPSKHARKLGKANAKVVLVGDSISTPFSVDGEDRASTFENQLRNFLVKNYPSCIFANRAIGGLRYFDLGREDSVMKTPNPSYPWYYDSSRRWMDYIRDEKPDVVILAFGMNDANAWYEGNFKIDTFYSMMEELRTMPSRPDIIFCTNILPSSTTDNTSFSSFKGQNQRNEMAGFTRSYAELYGYGYIDFNRYCNADRDGIDLGQMMFKRTRIKMTIYDKYTYDSIVYGYASQVYYNDKSELDGGITFGLSRYPTNFLRVERFGDRKVRINAAMGQATSTGYQQSYLTEAVLPDGPFVLGFSLSGSSVQININNHTVLYSGPVLRFGGLFLPEINVNAPVTLSFLEGTPLPVRTRYTDGEMFQRKRGTVGGNKLNHPTNFGSVAVFGPALYECGLQNIVHEQGSSVYDMFDNDCIAIDFINNKAKVRNSKYPLLNKDYAATDMLSFVKGSAVYHEESGLVTGILVGGDNLPFIEGSKYLVSGQQPSGMTIVVEYKLIDKSGSTDTIIHMGENTASPYIALLQSPANQARVVFNEPGGTGLDIPTSTSTPLDADKWHTVVMSTGSFGSYIVVDGLAKIQTLAEKTPSAYTGASTKLRLGHTSNSQTNVPKKVISKMAIFFGETQYTAAKRGSR